jgi:hypothetical protein
MYYYWVRKAIRPSFIANLGKGELEIIYAFFEREIEERQNMMGSSMGELEDEF